MIVDAHCHLLPPDFAKRHTELAARDATYAALFPQPGGRMAAAPALLRAMDAAAVDHAVIMGFGWTDPAIAAAANDYLIAAVNDHPDRLSAFASVNPAWGTPAIAEAVRCFDAGAVGIGELHSDTQNFDLTNPETMAPLLDELRRRNLPLTVHASEPVGHHYPGKGAATPEKLLALATNFPDNRIILAHLGGGLPFYAAMPEVAAALSNIRYDTAALPYLYRPAAIRAAAITAGPDRILFGSDYPLLHPRRVAAHIADAGLTPPEIASIMGANAAEFLNLPPI